MLADEATQRALKSLRTRHLDQIRASAQRMADNAGYTLARLAEGGSLPLSGFDMAAEAVAIREHRWALEAIDEVVGLYEAQAAEGSP